jgi:hypothetical protein
LRIGLCGLSDVASIANHLSLAAAPVPGASLDPLRDEIVPPPRQADSVVGPAKAA